jgi:hypothetical protein
MDVLNYRLCKEHDVYYLHACPCCYLSDMRRVEAYTRHSEAVDLRGLAYLRATSTRLPNVP